MLFTDVDDGRYFAPFAYIQGQPSKQGLLDMKFVIDNEELPDHVQPLKMENLIGMKRGVKPYAHKALGDIKRALVQSGDLKQGVDLAASLMEQHFKTNPH
jgi:hypothetical protein